MIVQAPHPVLTSPAKAIGKIDKKVLEVIEEMKSTLIGTRNPRGVGLAAPQIGKSLQIFITRPKLKGPIDVFINPKIVWKSGETQEIEREEKSDKKEKDEKKLEGCLSINNVWGHLRRASKVKLQYTDIKGKVNEIEAAGFLATILQHEADHLQGILFTQRVLEQKDKLFRIEEDDKGEEKLVEIKI